MHPRALERAHVHPKKVEEWPHDIEDAKEPSRGIAKSGSGVFSGSTAPPGSKHSILYYRMLAMRKIAGG